MRKILAIAILALVPSLISAQKHIKLYNKGVEFYKQEKYIEADSLFGLAIDKRPNGYRNPDMYFDRAITKLYLQDTIGYCNNLKLAADYNDRQALKFYKNDCLEFDDEAYSFFVQGLKEFDLKNYKRADSLLALSINTFEYVDNVLLKGITRLSMLDTSGFCADMHKIYRYDKRARQNYQLFCKIKKTANNSIEYAQQPCPCSLESEDASRHEEGFGDDVFFVVENMPKFNGKRSDAFRYHIQENLKYPAEAQEKGIQGRVFVQIDICKNGEVRNAKIVRGVHEILDNEVLRVVAASPKWSPGLQRNKPVVVRFTFPVVFQL